MAADQIMEIVKQSFDAQAEWWFQGVKKTLCEKEKAKTFWKEDILNNLLREDNMDAWETYDLIKGIESHLKKDLDSIKTKQKF